MYAMVTGLPEHKIRVISPDLGGGFGNKVPIYPGYLCAIVGVDGHRPAGEVDGGPVREPDVHHVRPRLPHARRDRGDAGRHGSWACGRGCSPTTAPSTRAAQPTKFPAGFFHIFTGSYDLQAAYCEVTGVYTNKAPGGVAYSCSFRITEAVYLVERLVDMLARELGMDPAELRMQQPAAARAVPLHLRRPAGSTTRATTRGRCSWRWTSPDTTSCGASRPSGGRAASTWGSGFSFFTEGVGAGPREHMDILGLGMADGADLRVHPTGKAVLGISVQTQGQGHETTFAQIVAEELGLSPDDVEVVHGDTDRTPFGLGTYGSRSTPVSGAAAVMAARKVRERARLVAAAMLELSADDLEWAGGKWRVRGDPEKAAASPRSRWRRTPRWSCPTAWRATWTPPLCTTRRT